MMVVFSPRSSKPDIRKGDFVYILEDQFPPGYLGVCLDDYRYKLVRSCDIYGFVHESGSVYADHLMKLEIDGEGFKKNLIALYVEIQRWSGIAPDWQPEYLERNQYLKEFGK